MSDQDIIRQKTCLEPRIKREYHGKERMPRDLKKPMENDQLDQESALVLMKKRTNV